MATTSVTFRIEESLKKQADVLFEEMGMNMTTALNVFVKATIREGRIPFAIVSDEYCLRQRIRESIEDAQGDATDPNVRRLSPDELFAKLREKYGYGI